MNPIIEAISKEISIGWVFSVLIVGLFINLVAAYLKPSLDRLLAALPVKTKGVIASISSSASARLQEGADISNARVQYLLDHPEKVTEFRMIFFERKVEWLACFTFLLLLAIFGIVRSLTNEAILSPLLKAAALKNDTISPAAFYFLLLVAVLLIWAKGMSSFFSWLFLRLVWKGYKRNNEAGKGMDTW